MIGDFDDRDEPRGYASPPCYAAEIDPAYFGLAPEPDPQQARDVARWRTGERKRLRELRTTIDSDGRAVAAKHVAAHLDDFLERRVGDLTGRVISGYWPIKAELDLRPWLTSLHERGALVALPLVETQAAPLVFRRWTPETKMELGHWRIPVPPKNSPQVVPEIALSPVVGWDNDGYRLGYGGGYFDRTLASIEPRPLVIGVGMQQASIATIYPQPHDIPMSVIITEAGIQFENREANVSR